MINLDLKHSKEVALIAAADTFQTLADNNVDCILRHNVINREFTLYVDAFTFEMARKIYPKYFKSKTGATVGETIYIKYKWTKSVKISIAACRCFRGREVVKYMKTLDNLKALYSAKSEIENGNVELALHHLSRIKATGETKRAVNDLTDKTIVYFSDKSNSAIKKDLCRSAFITTRAHLVSNLILDDNAGLKI